MEGQTKRESESVQPVQPVHPVPSARECRRVLLKTDAVVLPLLTIAMTLGFLDKARALTLFSQILDC
jgi:hypothetical protein